MCIEFASGKYPAPPLSAAWKGPRFAILNRCAPAYLTPVEPGGLSHDLVMSFNMFQLG